jgi:hypothetical protein
MASLTGEITDEGSEFEALFTSDPGVADAPSTRGRVLIDTGATKSVINDRIVRELGLVPVELGTYFPAGDTEPRETDPATVQVIMKMSTE